MDIESTKNKVEHKRANSLISESESLEKTKITKKEVNIEEMCDENLSTLNKIHAILMNCSNLSKKQKLEFCESERYFMKLYLRKLKKNQKKS
ncbi:MAG: hypothetical protein ACFE9Z_05005 [Promethearchaeota archaeon]